MGKPDGWYISTEELNSIEMDSDYEFECLRLLATAHESIQVGIPAYVGNVLRDNKLITKDSKLTDLGVRFCKQYFGGEDFEINPSCICLGDKNAV